MVIGLLFLAIIIAYYVATKPPALAGDPAMKVTADQLVTEFSDHEDAATHKYVDQVLQVQGVIHEVIEQEGTFVILLGKEAAAARVSCTLRRNNDAVAYGLTTGDRLDIKGRCTGFLLDVVLNDCEVITLE